MLRYLVIGCLSATFFVVTLPALAAERPAIEITPRGKVLINKKVLGLTRNVSSADEDVIAESKSEAEISEEDIVDDAAEIEQIDLDFKNGQANLTTKTATGSAKRSVEKNDLLVRLDGAQKKDDVDIRFNGEKFEIKQGNIEVLTGFPIRIDPDASSLSIVTTKGEVLVNVLPAEAVEGLLSSNLLDQSNQVELIESSVGSNFAAYKIEGRKDAKLFALITLNFSVEVTVGVQTGENLSTKQPFLLRFLGFLFTK